MLATGGIEVREALWEDVSAVAKAHGGGGHRNAAGFQIPGP